MIDARLMLVMLAFSAAAGSLVGMLVAASMAARIVKKYLPAMPEFIAAEEINLTANVAVDTEGGNSSRLGLSITASELASLRVERWLEQRGLMMVPKGKDFTVPVRGGKHASR